MEPVHILAVTYNRTLKGYIEELARKQVGATDEIALEILTFANWALRLIGKPNLLEDSQRRKLIRGFGAKTGLDDNFLIEEVEYAMSRYLPEDIKSYLTARRDGRGSVPRIERPIREILINDVIEPYQRWKSKNKMSDWNDLAVALCRKQYRYYDVVIADETQDFSANQIRAIMNQLAPTHAVTFVLDTAQRIYARGFAWQEVGITIRPENSHRLSRNYRNTIEIARFAASLIHGLKIDDDATIPDFSKCNRHGPLPIVLKGGFAGQTAYAIKYIKNHVDLSNESVAFLHPLGGGWFNHLKSSVEAAKLDFVEMTRNSDWPQGKENIAFSTLYSAKGLEFDHVIILGLNAEVLPHGDEDEDDRLTTLRRLLAMGIGRAKKSIMLGYKPEDASKLLNYFKSDTYQKVSV